MHEYLVPAGAGEAEFTEKRSRFLGHVFPVGSEEEARARIEQVKKCHHDARHNCWCFRLKAAGAERYSDDGEPQGTAGQPMLGVFQKEGVWNVCCVVTRYFGGILLGAGGLVRAYSQSAKDALNAAGIAQVRRWTRGAVVCPYALFERVKLEAERAGGVPGEITYTDSVRLELLLPQAAAEPFSARITELTAGSVRLEVLEEVYRADGGK